MKKLIMVLAVGLVGLLAADQAQAQMNDMTHTNKIFGSFTTYPSYPRTFKMAAHDKYSPHPLYAYSHHGIDAQRTHEWNVQQSGMYPWHGQYNHWRWQRPTALVVPPTASFHTEYNWGVGQTRSEPIYHQFGRDMSGGMSGGGGGFQNPPHWPSSTGQLGVYPVRAPWHH